MSRKQDRVAASDPKLKDTGTFYDPNNAGAEPVSHGATARGPHFVPAEPPVSATAIAVEGDLTADHTLAADVGAQGSEAGMTERQKLIADVERIKGMRKPFGAFTQKLALPERPGYKRHWFNDTGARVEEAISSGWAFVSGNDGKNIRRVVGTGRDNGVLYAMAMEIPKVFWQEDMDARHEAAAGRMEELKAKPFKSAPGQSKPSDAGKFYSPDDAAAPISITTR